MGRKMTAFSDLTGAEVPEDQLGRLVVRNHPSLNGGAVYLEALPEEVSALERSTVPVVTVEWQPPGGESKTYTLTAPEFDKLAKGGKMAELLADAPKASGRRQAAGGESVDYGTLEHAGRPHKGRVSPAEAEFVRANLSAVNERLASEGHRLIDPTNKEHKERYSL